MLSRRALLASSAAAVAAPAVLSGAHAATPKGIAVNALRPGAVKTEMSTRELGEEYDWSGWTTPDAVVPAVVWLAGQRGTGFTGRVIDSPAFGSAWP